MVTLDRIRLTGLLRRSPGDGAFPWAPFARLHLRFRRRAAWYFRCMSAPRRSVAGRTAVVGIVLAVGFSIAVAPGSAARRPRLNPIPEFNAPHICVETRRSKETIGDLNALRSCAGKPG